MPIHPEGGQPMKPKFKTKLLVAALAAVPMAAMPAATATAQAVVSPSQEIVLSIGKGELVTVPGTMADVFVANDDIADVQVKSQRQLYVFGNKVQANLAEISKADFEASIERKVDFVVPYDIKAASNAAKLGQVFVDANRSSKATAAIRQIAERVMGVSTEDAASVAGEKKSLLGNFDLKSMLAKKPKVDLTEAE